MPIPPKHIQYICLSKLCFGLRLFKDRFHPGGLHHIAFHLQLTTHKQVLRSGLPIDQFAKVGIRKDEGHVGLLALRSGAGSNLSGLLQINMPVFLLASLIL